MPTQKNELRCLPHVIHTFKLIIDLKKELKIKTVTEKIGEFLCNLDLAKIS